MNLLPLVLLLSLSAPTTAPEPANCKLVFAPDETSGHFVASITDEACRSQLIARDHSRLTPTSTFGRVEIGRVSLSDAIPEDGEAVAAGGYRWHVELPGEMAVPVSVSVRITHIESSQAVLPARVTKCNITRKSFDLVVFEAPGARLHDLEMEWIAYEIDPPLTPSTCNDRQVDRAP